MSIALSGIGIRPMTAIPTQPRPPNRVDPIPKVAASPAPSRTDTTDLILSRPVRPQEIRSFHPSKLHEFTFPEVSAQRPEPLDPPDPDRVEPRSYDLIDPRTPTRTKPLDPEPTEIRSFNFPDPMSFRSKEMKDRSADPLQGPETGTLNPGELKPDLKFEEMFFRPQEFPRSEAFEPLDMEPMDPRVPGGVDVRVLDLPNSESYRNSPLAAKISPRLAEAYRDGDKVIQQFSHDPMSHWHYHYVPVPADDIPPPRNRNVVLPRIGGVLDRTA